jgi:hypothetical protein
MAKVRPDLRGDRPTDPRELGRTAARASREASRFVTLRYLAHAEIAARLASAA